MLHSTTPTVSYTHSGQPSVTVSRRGGDVMVTLEDSGWVCRTYDAIAGHWTIWTGLSASSETYYIRRARRAAEVR